MSGPPTLHTFTTNEVVTAANMNQNASGISWLLNSRPRMLARANTATTTLTNTVWGTIASLDTVITDTESGFSTVTGKYTVAVAGTYVVSGCVAFATSSAGSNRGVRINRAGVIQSPVAINAPAGSVNTVLTTTVLMGCAVGDTIWMEGLQDTGGNLATVDNYASNHGEASYLSIQWLRS